MSKSYKEQTLDLVRAPLLGLRASRCSLKGSRGHNLSLVLCWHYPDTAAQTHFRDGCVFRVCVCKRQRPRHRHWEGGKKSENAPIFITHSLERLAMFFHILLSVSPLVKRAITCPGEAHIKQTLVLSAEPDSAKLHCFQMPVTKTYLHPSRTLLQFFSSLLCSPASPISIVLFFPPSHFNPLFNFSLWILKLPHLSNLGVALWTTPEQAVFNYSDPTTRRWEEAGTVERKELA